VRFRGRPSRFLIHKAGKPPTLLGSRGLQREINTQRPRWNRLPLRGGSTANLSSIWQR
ncbi:unnamed protein product, partial [Nesidiocoris tenuis]